MMIQFAILMATRDRALWQMAAMVISLVLIFIARRARRKNIRNRQAAFLMRFPDAAKLYVEWKRGDMPACFKILRVNESWPCRFSDRAGRGVFVPPGKNTVILRNDAGPIPLVLETAPYGVYRLVKNKNEKPMIVEMESL